MSRIVLAGGGTGGHVYPALAIGDVLRSHGHTVLYYGDGGRLEARVAPQRGYTFRPVEAAQYPRGGLVGRVKFALALLKGIVAVRRMLKQDKVDAVLGVGGYIAAPTVLAAASLGIPRVIHEANVVPGMANQLCARVADRVLLTYAATASRIKSSAPKVVVGVPVNRALLGGDRAAAAARYGLDPHCVTVLFVGGSLGAARLNDLAIALSRDPSRGGVQILHLTGPKYEADVRAGYGTVPPGVSVVGYEDQMAFAYAMGDLVVARAGSSTLAELAAAGCPSLLVPSPNVTENHQEENARGLEAAGAAAVVVEHGWDVAANVRLIVDLMADPVRLAAMRTAALGCARLDAAERAADVVEGLL